MKLFSGLTTVDDINDQPDLSLEYVYEFLQNTLRIDEINNMVRGIDEELKTVVECIDLYEQVDKYGSTEEFHVLLQNTGLTRKLGISDDDLVGSGLHKRDVYKNGIFDKIISGIKWVIGKIRDFFVWIYTKIRDWVYGTKALNKVNVQQTIDYIKDAPRNVPFDSSVGIHRYSDIKAHLFRLNSYVNELGNLYNYTVTRYTSRQPIDPVKFYREYLSRAIDRVDDNGITAENTDDKSILDSRLNIGFVKTIQHIFPQTLGDQDWSAAALDDTRRQLDTYEKQATAFSDLVKKQIGIFDIMMKEAGKISTAAEVQNIKNTTINCNMLQKCISAGLLNFAHINDCIKKSRYALLAAVEKFRHESAIASIPLGR